MTAAPVLVVDDDPDIRDIVAQVLDLEGYAVATAVDGADALRVLDQVHPGLVLLDMRMPVLDGWGFAREVRARGLELCIVVMTAAQDAGRWAREINADAFVAKPFDLNDLLDTVGRLSQRSA